MATRGFTLIELLIVVAIILILMEIALPNLIEAQIRAKAARVVSDMRTFSLAVESYALDWRRYPPYGRVDPGGAIQYPATTNSLSDLMAFVGAPITTPVGYLDSVPADLFAENLDARSVLKQIEYLNLDQHVANFGPSPPPFASGLIPAWGQWRMVSAGPDGDRGADIKANKVYSPTNGTRSDGDLVRCRRYQDNAQNPRLSPPET
ncbi:MAG: type II secretion system protein [Candidatus Omnitrophica bacterium]|nr:hypothetical protein [bacterium]NUN94701.1 type II secretion system protein [Candidatus Omnitrophota bacterium]